MKSWIRALMLMCSVFVVSACDNSDDAIGTGEVEFEITDAPTDDSNVKGVFVTVADVKVNGKSIAGFAGKQTINLKAYQEGVTKFLGKAELAARTYTNLTLVLDLNTDENGNSPGCYVLGIDNAKYRLSTTASDKAEIALTKAWTVFNNTKTKVVLDVDLRKAIRYSDDADAPYTFVGSGELSSAIRVVTREKTGTIKGTFDGEVDNNSEHVIVYAYKKGTFNASTETQANDGVMFRNAVNSTNVNVGILSNTYTLAFMEEGEYELVFANYNKNNTTGKLSFESVIETNLEMDGTISNIIKVKAGVSLNITASASASS